MTDTTPAGDYRITITKSEKYRVARDGNPENILGRTAGCRRLMYNRMLNATKAGTNKKGKYTWHTPNYPAFLDKENENETYLLEVPKQVYAQAFVDLQRAHQNHANNPSTTEPQNTSAKTDANHSDSATQTSEENTPKETSVGLIRLICVFRKSGQSM